MKHSEICHLRCFLQNEAASAYRYKQTYVYLLNLLQLENSQVWLKGTDRRMQYMQLSVKFTALC